MRKFEFLIDLEKKPFALQLFRRKKAEYRGGGTLLVDHGERGHNNGY